MSSTVLELDNLSITDEMDSWTDAPQQGIPIDVVYLDFSKAFDSVPHQR